MNQALKKRLFRYGISGLFCIGMAGLYAGLRDFFSLSRVEQYLVLCDAFTIPGMLLILLGMMVFLSNHGALDGLGYVLSYAFKALIPGKKDRQERYFDYVERKHSEGKAMGYGFLFITGGISLLISFVFMFLFYQLY